jgi:hypothetical protein
LVGALFATQSPRAAKAGACIDYQDHVHWAASLSGFSPRDVALTNDLALVVAATGVGLRLDVFSITAPAAPVLIGEIDLTGSAADVAVAGDRAYIAAREGGLEIIDISDPAAPGLIGGIAIPDEAVGLAVAGQYAYVISSTVIGSAALQVVDVSDPAAPEIAGSIDLLGVARDVAVAGSYVYVACRQAGLQVVDVSDPASPHVVGDYDVPSWAICVALSGSRAYLVDRDTGLKSLDITQPATPTLLGGTSIAGLPSKIAVSDGMAYVTSGDFDPRFDHFGLEIVDLSDPSSPRVVGALVSPGDSGGVAVAGDYAYVTDDLGLQIADVSNPNRPESLGSVDILAYNVFDLATKEGLACVATGSGIVMVDYSNPASLFVTSKLVVSALGVAIAGDYVYVVGNDGLTIIGISNPSSPAIVGHTDIPGDPWDIAITSNYALVAARDAGLQVIDITNPTAPAIVGTAPVPSRQVAVAGNYACTSNFTDEVQIIDISNPAAPIVAGVQAVQDNALGLAMAGNLVYVADRYFGLEVVDISTPSAPVVVGSVSTPDYAAGIAIAGDRAYIADYGAGPQVVDIAVPSSPAIIGTRSATQCEHIATDGNHLVIVDRLSFEVLPLQCSVPNAVLLTSFVATPVDHGGILLTWRTAREWNHLGFHVHRSMSASEMGDRLTTSLIEAPGPYSFRDLDLEPGITYYYRLAAVDRGGETQIFGPIAAQVDGSQAGESAGPAPGTSLALAEPNPFLRDHPHATFRFSLEQRAQVNLRLFDAQGRLVRSLFSGEAAAGPHAVRWDGRNDRGQEVAAGTFFYRLETAGFVASRRLVRLR